MREHTTLIYLFSPVKFDDDDHHHHDHGKREKKKQLKPLIAFYDMLGIQLSYSILYLVDLYEVKLRWAFLLSYNVQELYN